MLTYPPMIRPALLCLVLAAPAAAAPTLSRADFNRLAAQTGLPLFWAPGAEGELSPKDLVPVGDAAALSRFAADGKFTPAFDAAYARLVEAKRLETVRRELDQGRPNLLVADLRSAPEPDRALARHLSAAGRLIDGLYQRQTGGLRWKDKIKDAASLAVYERNSGPWCEAPATDRDPFCNAVASFPPRRADAYPANLSHDGKMCDELRARPDGPRLLDPFTVVREKEGKLVAVPLHQAYGPEMRQVAVELRAAAAAQGPEEAALKAYLLGAAKGFETNDWAEADETWSRMNSRNTKWYLRVAPDEVFDPCQEKAGFHVSFARIDPASLAWQDKLTPLRQEMEDTLAALIGPDYAARPVAFALPDFIEILLNSGDSKHPLGATVGQSLPNWGKVAEENRRRTVVMTNLFEDPDSKKTAREKASQLLDAETMKSYAESKEPGLIGVILHEATHNLGPHSDSRIKGRPVSEVFGGRLVSVLEEFKAQTAGLWYVELLRRKGLVSDEVARQIFVHEMAWCFGHISNGYFTDTGAPKPYSQLSAVQIGRFVRDGALSWVAGEDGVERVRIDFEKLPKAIEDLTRDMGRLYASGDAKGAQAMIDEYLSGPGAASVRAAEVQSRLRKYPKESYRYTIIY